MNCIISDDDFFPFVNKKKSVFTREWEKVINMYMYFYEKLKVDSQRIYADLIDAFLSGAMFKKKMSKIYSASVFIILIAREKQVSPFFHLH